MCSSVVAILCGLGRNKLVAQVQLGLSNCGSARPIQSPRLLRPPQRLLAHRSPAGNRIVRSIHEMACVAATTMESGGRVGPVPAPGPATASSPPSAPTGHLPIHPSSTPVASADSYMLAAFSAPVQKCGLRLGPCLV